MSISRENYINFQSGIDILSTYLLYWKVNRAGCTRIHNRLHLYIKYVESKFSIGNDCTSRRVPPPLLISGQQTRRTYIRIVSNRQRCQAATIYCIRIWYHAWGRPHKCVTVRAVQRHRVDKCKYWDKHDHQHIL